MPVSGCPGQAKACRQGPCQVKGLVIYLRTTSFLLIFHSEVATFTK